MLRFSGGVNLAIHAMGYLARHGGGPLTAPHVAEAIGVSRDHLKKVCQRLAKVGLLTSRRGPRGGFTLARPGEEISFLEIVEAIEGPWKTPACVFGGHICGDACVMHDVTVQIHEELRQKLASANLMVFPDLD